MSAEPRGAVALTGGTGFIGARLISQLCAAGMQVRALRRSPRSPVGGDDSGVQWIQGDLASPDALQHLVAGARAVVHCAGAVRGTTWDDFARVNVEGTRVLAAAARRAGLPMLLISSLAAREPRLSHYARSKREGEEVAMESGVRATVLRPPAVYGPGDKELKPLLDIMWRGLAVVPHHAHPFSLIHVEDVVSAALAWLSTPNCPAGPFEVDDGRAGGYRWNDIIVAVSRLSGRRTRVLRVPRGVLMVPATINSLVGRLGLTTPMVTPGKVNELFHSDWVCHSAPFAASTSWRPSIGLDAGLRSLFGDPATERA